MEKNENLEFYGIDGSQAMLDLATKRLYKYRNKITYIQTKLEKISTIAFPEKSGNIVLSIQTLHNLNNQTKSIIYDRVINWLQPGGLLIIMDRIRPYPPTCFPIYKTLWNYLEEKHLTTINDGQDLDYNAHAKKLEDKGDYPLTLLENVLMLERVGFKTATIHLVGNRAIFVGLKSFDIQ